MGAIKQQMIRRQEQGLCIACEAAVDYGVELCGACEPVYERDQAEVALRSAIEECKRLRVNVEQVLEQIRAEQAARMRQPIMPGQPATDEEMPF